MSCVGICLSLGTSPDERGQEGKGVVCTVTSIAVRAGSVRAGRSRWVCAYPDQVGWSHHLFSLPPARRLYVYVYVLFTASCNHLYIL